jgi:hypothetical protein
MPIEKITASQFGDQLRTQINDRTTEHDTGFGPVRDIVIDPVAAVLEQQNDRVRRVSLLLSLTNNETFSEEDLNDFVFNEGLLRLPGSQATANVIFARVADPNQDVSVIRGYPVGSAPDESTGQTVTFVASESRTLPSLAGGGGAFFNQVTGNYELTVPYVAVIDGSIGQVGANRITRPLRALNGFDNIFNREASSGGRDSETNNELIERYLIAILGRRLATPTGIEKFVRDDQPDVNDILTVFGANPILTRDSSDAGAVDAYIVGDQLITAQENHTFLGVGQVIAVDRSPLISVSTVVSGAITYVEGDDFELVFDNTGIAGSNRGVDGIRFLAGGSLALPAIGDTVNIKYVYNNLVRSLQTQHETDRDVLVMGRDLLFKIGVQVDVAIEATLTVLPGFDVGAVTTAVRDIIFNFVNALELGDNVERSDIQGEVRRLSGVDNLVFTRFSKLEDLVGIDDIPIVDNEYARIADIDLIIN